MRDSYAAGVFFFSCKRRRRAGGFRVLALAAVLCSDEDDHGADTRNHVALWYSIAMKRRGKQPSASCWHAAQRRRSRITRSPEQAIWSITTAMPLPT